MDDEQLYRFESEVRRIRGYSPIYTALGLVLLLIMAVAPMIGAAQPAWFNLMMFFASGFLLGKAEELNSWTKMALKMLGVIKGEQHEC